MRNPATITGSPRSESVISPRDSRFQTELLAGMAMDAEGTAYRTYRTLLSYCFRVAGTVGLMMSHVMGVRHPTALTHAAHIDDEALGAALRSDCLYVGALGSRTTHAKRLERLKAAGLSDEALARIHAPIGLAIGAKGPAEIAVSILAEIIQVARGAA